MVLLVPWFLVAPSDPQSALLLEFPALPYCDHVELWKEGTRHLSPMGSVLKVKGQA